MARRLGRLKTSKKKLKSVTYNDWPYGENRLLSGPSIRPNELTDTKNIVLVESGLPRGPRWGYSQLGVDLTGNRICLLERFENSSGVAELLSVTAGKLRMSVNDGANWSEISGITFTIDQDIYGVQAYGKFWLIAEDTPLCYYDGSTVVTFTAISSTSWKATPITLTGLSAGNYTYHYRIVATNNQGQALASTQASISVNKSIVEWSGTTEYATLNWNATAGATGYEIYRSTIAGEGELLDYVDSQAVESFDDLGGTEYVTNPLIGLPEENTTGGVTGVYIDLYKDSLVICGRNSRLHYSGAADVIGHFNRKDGGGWIDINKDSEDGNITATRRFQDIILVFKERSIWQFDFTTETSIGVRMRNVTKAVGCVAPKSIQTVENDVFFFSERGVFIIGNEAQFLNLIRTNELSARERPRVKAFNQSRLRNVCSVYFDSKYWLFYSNGGDITNNNAIMYDRERMGWTYHTDLPVGVAKVFYNDSGERCFMGNDGDDKVYGFSDSYTDDDGSIIDWLVSIRAEDFDLDTIYKTSKDAHVKISDVSGQVRVRIIQDGTETIKDTAITAIGTDAGMGIDLMGIDLMGVGEETDVDLTSAILRRSLRLKRKIWLNQKVEFSNIPSVKSTMILRAVHMSAKSKSPRKNKLGERI